MIGSLRGQVLERDLDGSVLLEVGGVGYVVTVSPRTLAELEPTTTVFLHVHHHIREDAQTLYGFLTRDDQPIGPFGVMGGFMQAQGHLQMAVNMIDYGFNPQVSLDAPRWCWAGGRQVAIEQEVDPAIVQGLRDRGHEVVLADMYSGFGRGQIITRLPGGGYQAASDKRADGAAVGY